MSEDTKELLHIIKQHKIKLISQIKEYEKNHGSEFFKPFEHQQKFIDLIHIGKKTIVLQGANQIGKTIVCSNIVGSFAIGKQMWDGKASIFGMRPTKGRIICADWDHHAREVIVPKLKEWIPMEYETRKNNTGVEAFWEFKNGSSFELMTHVQDTKSHEGWSGDWVWADEPLPRDKYTANKRGLVASNGIFLLTMTALTESWILDEIVLNPNMSIGCVTNVPIEANKSLDSGAIGVFKSSVPDDEYEARIRGGWLQLTGLVLKEFNKEKHIIKPFDIPTDYPVVAMIDLHLSTPQAIGFYAKDPMGRTYVIDEIWENLSPEDVSDKIIRLKNKNSWRLQRVFIDPLSKGDSAYMKNRFNVEDSYSIIKRRLSQHGIFLDTASKDKESGVRNLKDDLKGINGTPVWYVFDNCKRHIYEYQRWIYNDIGLPQKENDHFCENSYRFTLTGTKYTSISETNYVPQYEPANINIGY